MSGTREKAEVAKQSLLRAIKGDLGSLAPEWERAFLAVPRHLFLPSLIWPDVNDRWVPCVREREPGRWLEAAYANSPIVTQVNDGRPPGDDGVWPSSSASAPSIVFRMLEMLDIHDGMRLLEIGTGSGWNAGLLTARLGGDRVTSVEVDRELTERARDVLAENGQRPLVVFADGAAGYSGRAPYDRIVSTCSVRRVPYAWVEQSRPGTVVLTPWDNPWFCYGLLRLVVAENGTASGRFAPYSAFMLMRGQRSDIRLFRDVVRDEHRPDESSTELSPWEVTTNDRSARFAVGLWLGDVWHAWDEDPKEDGAEARLWLATTDASSGSWAAVDWDGKQKDRFRVRQYGPRRLWDETEAAYQRWRAAGDPGPERFGLTVTQDGQVPWIDRPPTAIGRATLV
ncbi:methyltransferase [Streptomyces sp. NPDC059863]|uniref:methyltransferase n=1 Tax=unclassified Streptomyces TaxID=2593676 RepID=UPI00364A4C89